MSSNSTIEVPFMEWEFLKKPFEFPEILDKGKLPDGVEHIKAYRTAEYTIELDVRGTSTRELITSLQFRPLGSTESPFSISAADSVRKVVAAGVFNGNKIANFAGPFEMKNTCSELTIEYPAQTIKYSSLYFINSPRFRSSMLRGTRRTQEKLYSRERGQQKVEKSLSTTHQSSSDYFQIKIASSVVNFCQTPGEYVPDWTKCCTLELEEHKFTETQLAAITEALSFVLGKHLIKVGATDFSSEWEPVKAYSCVPHHGDVKTECRQPEMPPVRVDPPGCCMNEGLISEIVERYLGKHVDYNLRQAMILFWAAQRMPMETQLVKLHSALSSLRNTWFKSIKSKSKGKYMLDSEYEKYLAPIMNAIESIPERKIVNKIVRANGMGENEKMDAFFEEIGLPIGDIERKSIRLRNRFAHGEICQADGIDELLNACRAYQTLVSRVILKLLEYDGKYIDYSTLDFPERHINEPLGGASVTGVLG